MQGFNLSGWRKHREIPQMKRDTNGRAEVAAGRLRCRADEVVSSDILASL
jgi:hypothetical protein